MTDTSAPRLTSDMARYWLVTAVAAVLALVGAAIAETVAAGITATPAGFVSFYFGACVAICTGYGGLTWLTFRHADGFTLASWLRETEKSRRRRRLHEFISGSGGATAAVSFCATAIGAVVIAASLPELRNSPVVLVLAVLVVASSWLLIVITYALQYARDNTESGGIAFAGESTEGPPTFADYVHLSVQIGTAFSTANVTVTRRSLRRTMTTHSVIAFAFNTVAIALLVSLLVTIAA